MVAGPADNCWGSAFFCGREAAYSAVARRPPAPRLVDLDEPTAHIDPATEALLYGRLRTLAQEAIVLLVAHRPEAQQYCDETFYLPAVDAA